MKRIVLFQVVSSETKIDEHVNHVNSVKSKANSDNRQKVKKENQNKVKNSKLGKQSKKSAVIKSGKDKDSNRNNNRGEKYYLFWQWTDYFCISSSSRLKYW